MPTRVVAVNPDTGRAMLERTYSRHIGEPADALARKALLDTTGSGHETPLRLVPRSKSSADCAAVSVSSRRSRQCQLWGKVR